jgi:shikimate dehydrogenase
MADIEKIVLIGSAIAHSRSPYLHNHLFDRYHLPYRYELMPLREEEVVHAIGTMKRGGYRGANITSPHKQVALPALDELSEEARAIGAVNTIIFDAGRAVGHNTDARGFARSLDDQPVVRDRFTAAILGTGGAAMAAAYALLAIPGLRTLTLYSRDAARAQAAAGRWNDPRVAGESRANFTPADLLINATPVGLPGRPGIPLDPDLLPGTTLLYEMIYSPAETALARSARERGIATMNGRAMFEGQAIEAFRLWTGREVGREGVPEGIWEGFGGMKYEG